MSQVGSLEVRFVAVNDKEGAEVRKLMEETSKDGLSGDRLFIHNSPEFLKVYADLPEALRSKLVYVQSPYVPRINPAHLKTEAKETLFVDRLSHLADLECLSDLKLSFPKVPAAVKIDTDFQAEELDFWRSAMRLESPTRFSGYPIVEGKKVGRKLGIPTGGLTSEHFRRKRPCL